MNTGHGVNVGSVRGDNGSDATAPAADYESLCYRVY
jgi:hypothetical protein